MIAAPSSPGAHAGGRDSPEAKSAPERAPTPGAKSAPEVLPTPGPEPQTMTPTANAVMAQAQSENFPVALRLLGGRVRTHLLAVYGFARLADELGDSFAGDRLAALDRLEEDLDRAFHGEAEHPLLRRLQPTLRECELPREPFLRLIEANRIDQRVSRSETWEQLRGYCERSANPVGELVLGVVGQATPSRVALSDQICTALQLIEHCQDVAEDLAAGRVYLPAEDLAHFGCTLTDLSGPHALRAAARDARSSSAPAHAACSARGAPLIGGAARRKRLRLAVAAFLAGGRAALEAIERAGYEVLAGPPQAGAARRLRALARTLVGRGR